MSDWLKKDDQLGIEMKINTIQTQSRFLFFSIPDFLFYISIIGLLSVYSDDSSR